MAIGSGDARKCVFVVSHPRSGTHLLIDFIRQNFPAFNPRLMPWESSSKLYLNLDGADWKREACRLRSARTTHILAQSHLAGYTTAVEQDVLQMLCPSCRIYLYPIRRFSSLVKSFAEFSGFRGPIGAMLTQRDRFFGRDATVGDCIREHVQCWLDRDAAFVDFERLLSDPAAARERLAALLGEKPAHLRQPLPRRKLFAGKAGELLQRVSGRQSTEVVIPHKLPWRDADEPKAIDSEFVDLYARLTSRRVN